MKFKFILMMTLGIAVLVSCQAPPSRQNDIGLFDWKYADLRLLDPNDADQPDQDMIAFYTRINDPAFQLRIDFLDLGASAGKDIHIFIDTNPGGSTQIETKDKKQLLVDIPWDYMIKQSASGSVEFIDDQLSTVYGAALFILRDRALGSLIFNINQNILPINLGKTQLQIIVTSPDQNLIIDKSAPFSIDAPSPARGKVLFAFWNAFNVATPAQTLRSWDGAHTGSMRTRHGLHYLLEAAEQTSTTVFLLDQMKLDTLSALDYIGVLPKIEQMKAKGTLIL